MDKQIVFQLDKASFSYGPGEKIFTDFSLMIHRGEKVCLLGANGSGKSTLMKILCALKYVAAGSFSAFGARITEKAMQNDSVSQNYHRRVGFIFQNSDVQLFTTRVWDEIAFGPMQLGIAVEEVKKRVEDVIDMLEIKRLADRSPHRLSGGEKKKVAMASVLVLNPDVLILDEPTAGLDPRTQRWLVELLLELHKNGRTIITSTHNLELAHVLSDRAIILSEEHRLVFDGPTGDAIGNKELLTAVNLIEPIVHNHDHETHVHIHTHG